MHTGSAEYPFSQISDLASQNIPEDKILVAYIAWLNEKELGRILVYEPASYVLRWRIVQKFHAKSESRQIWKGGWPGTNTSAGKPCSKTRSSNYITTFLSQQTSSSFILHICIWNNHKISRQSLLLRCSDQMSCTQKNQFISSELSIFITMHHFLHTQLLTCSSNFFRNNALNGLPDVDLGIYNEDFLI